MLAKDVQPGDVLKDVLYPHRVIYVVQDVTHGIGDGVVLTVLWSDGGTGKRQFKPDVETTIQKSTDHASV